MRRYPLSRRNPQFNQPALAATLEEAAIDYVHAVELGGLLEHEPGEELFACLGQFAPYAARMRTEEWQGALEEALASPRRASCAPRHRGSAATAASSRSSSSLTADDVVHLIRPGEREPHRIHREAAHLGGKLYLCGEPIA